jgi:DNA-binding PadR family transcriptional regulator
LDSLTVIEQVYLIAIWHLKTNAYGVKIREKVIELTGKSIVFGTLYNNLNTLVKKGYVKTHKGDSGPDRGGNIKVFYSITEDGKKALEDSRELQKSLWATLPEGVFAKEEQV